jgi:asparagine synthase (glutamine-hydrolysing)
MRTTGVSISLGYQIYQPALQQPPSVCGYRCFSPYRRSDSIHLRGIQKTAGTFTVFSGIHQKLRLGEWDYSQKTRANRDLGNCEELITNAIMRHDHDRNRSHAQRRCIPVSSLYPVPQSTQRIKTFTMGFKDYPMEDILAAREVAKLYDTDHTEVILDHNVTDNLLELVWQFGEPFADSSAIPTYLISKAARQYITVMLTGDGGDEAFGGYGRTIVPRNAQIFSRIIPPFLHPLIGNILRNAAVNPESDSLFGKACTISIT